MFCTPRATKAQARVIGPASRTNSVKYGPIGGVRAIVELLVEQLSPGVTHLDVQGGCLAGSDEDVREVLGLVSCCRTAGRVDSFVESNGIESHRVGGYDLSIYCNFSILNRQTIRLGGNNTFQSTALQGCKSWALHVIHVYIAVG